MADATYVFDPEVFAFMFDITDVTPSILKVSVPEQHRKVAAGQIDGVGSVAAGDVALQVLTIGH